MFCITEGKVELVHKNERMEKHGDEDKLACDLKFAWSTTNGDLAMFAPDLRHALYKRADSAQGELDPDPEHLTALRFPDMDPFRWSGGELIGGSLTFHYGVKSMIKIGMTKLHKYRIEAMEGGTVVVEFQVQCRPNEQQSGKLSKFLVDRHCVISITPPADGEASGDLAGDDGAEE